MVKQNNKWVHSSIGFVILALILVGLSGASIEVPVMPHEPEILAQEFKFDAQSTGLIEKLDQLGLLSRLNEDRLDEFLELQINTKRSLAQILNDKEWQKELGLTSNRFLATWYVANPFEMLPVEIQKGIKKVSVPFKTRRDISRWLEQIKAPSIWTKAIEVALVETTPQNLWRASRGLRPYAKNGQFLEPIVIDHGKGKIETREGHIATDPRVIPTNSKVILLVRVKGKDHVLKVKAADIGQAIKGYHVDLPVHMSKPKNPMPYLRLPREYLHNPTVQILIPKQRSRIKTSLNRKA
ncbi:MAG: 3D domain-containing protein [Elusimicrobiota bacterium]